MSLVEVVNYLTKGPRVSCLLPFDKALEIAHPDAAVHWDRDIGGEDMNITKVYICGYSKHHPEGDLYGPCEVIIGADRIENCDFYRYLFCGYWVRVRNGRDPITQEFKGVQCVSGLVRALRAWQAA